MPIKICQCFSFFVSFCIGKVSHQQKRVKPEFHCELLNSEKYSQKHLSWDVYLCISSNTDITVFISYFLINAFKIFGDIYFLSRNVREGGLGFMLLLTAYCNEIETCIQEEFTFFSQKVCGTQRHHRQLFKAMHFCIVAFQHPADTFL